MLPILLPENPTVADLIAVLERIPPSARISDMAYRAITSVDIDQDGDALINVLPRVKYTPKPTAQFRIPSRLIEMAKAVVP